MRTLISLVVFTLLFFRFGGADAQKNSLLWEISGKNLERPSYLFGTIHMICDEDFLLPEKVKNALKETDQLMLEVNMADPEEMKFIQQHLFSDAPITESLDDDQEKELDSLLRKHINMSLQQVDNFKLITIYSLLLVKTVSCDNIKNYETELMKIAQESEKNVAGLESMKEQWEYLEKVVTMDYFFEQFRLFDEYKALFKEMLDAYKSEDLSKLVEMTSDPKFMDPESEKWLVTDRNNNWVEAMPALMEERPTFFAVGAAHLPGENGVIELLKKEGYTVKPVF